MKLGHLLTRALFAALCMTAVSCALAQERYPSRPIRLIVPWPPGGISDVISRGWASVAGEALGQQIVPDNRPGAAGTVGIGIAAKAPADGYTLVMTDVPSHAISASIYAKLPYDPQKDVQPVYLASRSPLVLVVNSKLGVKTIPQLIEYAKTRPGQLSFASSGTGSITHLAFERFQRDAGIKALHVPYKGGGPATAAVVSGEASMYFSCISAAIPHVKAGRLTLLGITSAKRSPLYPDTPTVAESISGFEMSCDTGLFAPTGTPRAIVERIYEISVKGEENPRMKDVLAANDATPGHLTPAQFRQYVAKEMKDWAEIVRAANLKLD